MTTDVQVRPDGKISLSLINEITAAGLTPNQLREHLTDESKKYMEDADTGDRETESTAERFTSPGRV